MKRTYKQLIFCCLLSLIGISCGQEFLNPANPTAITGDEVWQDQNLIQMYLNAIYQDRPGFDYNTYDNITDEARSNYPGNTPNQILIGQWDAVTNPMEFWAYPRVRRANEFLARIDGAPLTATQKATWAAEARFLRAFLYFDMVKRYGGVPLITTPQAITDDLQVSRNTADECFQFIVKELDQAIAALPSDAPRGKVSKGSAMALKGRVLLYYASPLFNPTNAADRWKAAADASKAVMDLNKYSLYPNLSTLWLDTGTNPEAIFEVQYRMPEKYHGWDALVKPLRLANNDAGQRSPVQELVNAFPMQNGKAPTEAGSGYDPNNPYVGRDGRFYAFIGYNGAKMKGTTSGPPVKEITLETYLGGRDFDADPATKIYNTVTAYYAVKGVNPDNTIYTYGYGSTQPWIELRYAETLLNYAEAQNEVLGSPDASVVDALNLVRKRAGITTPLTTGSLTKETARTLIRNERLVELCFEGKRYWDLRRWKTATTVLNGLRYSGALITKKADGSFGYSYGPVDPQPLVFTDRMYLMPIPQAELTKNKKLVQNPGW